MARRKKRTYTGRFVRFLLKLIFIYPFQGLWFLLKQLYYSIKEVRATSKEKKGEVTDLKGEKTVVKQSNKEAGERARPVQKGHLSTDHAFDPLTEVKHKRGKLTQFEEKLLTHKSTIGLILGARGSGKSAIGMRFLENFKAKTDKNVYALGFKPESLPGWINVIYDIEDLENDSVLLIDEGGIEFSSRKSMSDANTLLSKLLLIARHKDVSVMFITQNSSNLEINAIRQADYLILKKSSLLQKDFERGKIRDIYEAVEPEFEELSGHVGLTYLYTDSYQGFVTNSLPSFWNERVSKSYAGK